MKEFWLCFVPLFVAVDAIGVLPMFLAFIENMDRKTVHKIIYLSSLTASLVAVFFLIMGIALLKFLGITIADFMIAGGILLFVISMSDLITEEKIQRKIDSESLGIVPLGVPLITGPAVLTTLILLINEHNYFITIIALLINILIVGLVFFFAQYINKLLGKTGAKIISKIASLFLAGIGVMMVRKGIMFFTSFK